MKYYICAQKSITTNVKAIRGVGVCAQSWPTLCDPMDTSRQAPLSIEFPRQEYWNGLPFRPPGDLSEQRIKLTSLSSPALAGWFFPSCLAVNNQLANPRDVGSVPGSGRSPGGGHGNPLQYSCLENPMDKGAWWATVHRVAKSRTRLSRHILSVCERTHTPLGNPLFIYGVNTVLISHYMS